MLHLLVVTKYDTTTNRNGITEHKPAVRSIDHAAGFLVAEEVITIENKAKLKGIYFKISEKDRKLIEQKMELAGVRNMSAFLRKMAIDGYVINLELPELSECVRLARYTSNNVNQIARAVHSGGGVYPDDVNDIRIRQDETNRLLGEILEQLSRLK